MNIISQIDSGGLNDVGGAAYSGFIMLDFDKQIACRSALKELDSFFLGRMSDISRGAETPAIAGLMFEKYAWGLSNGLKHLDNAFNRSPFISTVIQTKADELVLELDPSYQANKEKRWKSRPADLSFHI